MNITVAALRSRAPQGNMCECVCGRSHMDSELVNQVVTHILRDGNLFPAASARVQWLSSTFMIRQNASIQSRTPKFFEKTKPRVRLSGRTHSNCLLDVDRVY
jgi:hypothetical protein